MDLTGIVSVVEPLAKLCSSWIITLLAKKVDGSELQIREFGPESERLTQEQKESVLQLFRQEHLSSASITDREDVIKESIEDDVDHNDIAQETELQALSEIITKEIDETPPTQEEIEVIEEIISMDSMVISSVTSHVSPRQLSTQSSTPPSVHPVSWVPCTQSLRNFDPAVARTPNSQARITHFSENEKLTLEDNSENNADLTEPLDWEQAGSDDEENSPTPTRDPQLLGPLAEGVLSAGLKNTTLRQPNPSQQFNGRQHPDSSMNVTPEPTVEIRSSCEILPVRLSHTEHIHTGQYASGTQIMQYQYDGREYEWQESKIDEGGFIDVMQETPLGERLITTPYLKKYGLSFNTRYQLLICTACAEGLPISYVYTHLTKPGATRLNKSSTSEWAASQVVFQHALPINKIPPKKQFRKDIMESLRKAGFTVRDADMDSNNANSSTPAWRTLPLPDMPISDSQTRHQILGLRVFDKVWKCTITGCTYIRATKGSIASHMSRLHRGSCLLDNTVRVYAQTLAEDRLWCSLMSVSEDPPVLVSNNQRGVLDNSRLNQSETLSLLRKKKAIALQGVEVVPDTDVRTIPPVFLRTGIDQFLTSFDRKALHRIFSVADRTNSEYIQLRSILLSMFTRNVSSMKTDPTHHSIYMAITNCTPGQPRQRRAFAALTTPAAIAAYGLLQVKFIWAILQAYRLRHNPRKSGKNMEIFFKFSEVQLELLEALSDALDEDCLGEDLLFPLLDSLYFPLENKTADSIFNSPVIAFIALLCLKEDGSYTSIHLIPPYISKIQFLIRSFALYKFNEWRKKLRPSDNQDKWLQKCKKFCELHLQDQNLSPFASVRFLLHFTSIASRSTARPDFVWWVNNTATVGDHTVDFDQFVVFLAAKIKETEKFVEDSVLLGVFTLSQVEETFKISCLKDPKAGEDVLGNGVLFDARNNTLDNPESAEVFHQMFQKNVLGLSQSLDGNLLFDHKESINWICNIHKALSVVQALAHITQGPGPGRMSEECIQTPTNTMNCPRNFAFDEREGTGGFRTGYNKNSFVADDHKVLFRLLPYSIFRLLYVLIRLIRPIEITVLLEFVFTTPEERQNLVNVYKERIWASWGQQWSAVDLSRNLQILMYEGTGAKIGARSYRHLAIAIQRHFPTTNYRRYSTGITAKETELALAADLMAGHTTAVAEMVYARQPDITTNAITKAHFVRVSKDWHALLKIPTAKLA